MVSRTLPPTRYQARGAAIVHPRGTPRGVGSAPRIGPRSPGEYRNVNSHARMRRRHDPSSFIIARL